MLNEHVVNVLMVLVKYLAQDIVVTNEQYLAPHYPSLWHIGNYSGVCYSFSQAYSYNGDH